MGSITETPPFELRVVLELRDVVDRGQELGKMGDVALTRTAPELGAPESPPRCPRRRPTWGTAALGLALSLAAQPAVAFVVGHRSHARTRRARPP